MTPWDDKQITRYQKRVALFRRRGWTEAKAEFWADRLTRRDSEREDMRLCIECSQLQQDGGCFAARQGWMKGVDRRMAPITDVLQRCWHFIWQKA